MEKPSEITSFDAKKYLALMATTWNSAASTQNNAFNSFLFLFRFVIHKPYENLTDTPRAKTKKAVPEILFREEIIELLRQLHQPYLLIAKLTYGCGFRLSEVLNLRIHNFKIDSQVLPP